ncbi:MAG: fluoride efflux transporter CrcB [Gemmatimonadota bacterium]
MAILFVALGSAIGGVGRFLISGALQRGTRGSFPIGTLVVNVVGSFILGFVVQYALEKPDFSPEARLFLTAGFCGAFTTFSTFSIETFDLIEYAHYTQALVYVAASLGVGLLATAAGFLLAKNIIHA